MVHPVQSVIESLYAAGRCPRLHVNALYDGVECPDFIRDQWRERLIIDLDPSYPLDLTFEEHALSADLSFGGYVTRCTFPYSGIYVVADRSTGRGIVLDQNMPESVKKSRYDKPAASGEPDGSRLEAVSDETEDEPSRETEPETEPAPPPRAAPARALEADDPPGDHPEPEDDPAQKRRAAFRVIDGGS